MSKLEADLAQVQFDQAKHSFSVLPLQLSDLKNVATFAAQTLKSLGQDKLDYLLLNAAVISANDGPGPLGSKWSEQYVVNHLCKSCRRGRIYACRTRQLTLLQSAQHYLIHLLKEKLVSSKSRIVVVSSGAVTRVSDTSPNLSHTRLTNKQGADLGTFQAYSRMMSRRAREFETHLLYCETKFIQLLGAHWWRRQLGNKCTVVAVSPGLIPGTGLSRHSSVKIPDSMLADAKSVPQGNVEA